MIVKTIISKMDTKILYYLYNNNPTNINRLAMTLQTVYCVAYESVMRLKSYGLVETEKKGREVKVSLSEKGKEIASLLFS